MAVGVDYKNWRNLPAEVRREVQGRYYRKDDSPRQCSGCGEVFQPGYADKRRKWCSLRCKRHATKKAERARGVRSNRRIGIRALGDRDGWKCHLCGRTVAVASATADHLVPQSLGGSGSPSNLRLAHMLCNSRRGARGPAQLGLPL